MLKESDRYSWQLLPLLSPSLSLCLSLFPCQCLAVCWISQNLNLQKHIKFSFLLWIANELELTWRVFFVFSSFLFCCCFFFLRVQIQVAIPVARTTSSLSKLLRTLRENPTVEAVKSRKLNSYLLFKSIKLQIFTSLFR